MERLVENSPVSENASPAGSEGIGAHGGRISRRLSASLIALGLSALSCDVGLHAALAPVDVGAPSVAQSAPPVSAQPVPAYDYEAEVTAILAILQRYRTGLAHFEVEALAKTIQAEAHRYQLTPSLVLAVMHVESRYNNFAVSPVGALGLMQVMPQTGEEVAGWIGVHFLGPQSLFDPQTNVAIGAAYLRWLLDRYHDLPTALAAYNWGPERISSRLRRGVPLPKEYPKLVLDSYAKRNFDRS